MIRNERENSKIYDFFSNPDICLVKVDKSGSKLAPILSNIFMSLIEKKVVRSRYFLFSSQKVDDFDRPIDGSGATESISNDGVTSDATTASSALDM